VYVDAKVLQPEHRIPHAPLLLSYAVLGQHGPALRQCVQASVLLSSRMQLWRLQTRTNLPDGYRKVELCLCIVCTLHSPAGTVTAYPAPVLVRPY
jgi:hypothetical protein